MSTSDLLDQIEARAHAATESGWRTSMDWADGDWPIESAPDGEMIGSCPQCGVRAGFERADAEFIAAARSDVPVLVRALQAVLDVHRPKYHYPNLCEGCDPGIMDPPEWPCSTVRAIEAALQEGS